MTNPSVWPPNIYNPQISQQSNRFASGQGYEYDFAGNVTQDATGKRFAYDAENKQTSYGTEGSSTNGASYYYDGDGKRVMKVTPSETLIFVYNIGGQLLAEFTTSTVQNNGTSYLISDTLGSPRVITKSDGSVRARHDYLPFGEELYASTGNRTTVQGYDQSSNPADKTRQKFTGHERDNETDLDFAQARYFNSKHGRFTSVDPIMITKTRLTDPQSINLYVYTRNNPLKYVDPTGEYFVGRNGMRVGFKINDKKKIVLGKNASADLVRLARSINKSGSETALAQFAASATNETKNHFKIESKEVNNGLLGLHQAHDKNGKPLEWEKGADGTGKFIGQPAYIKDKDGNMVYKEATITIFAGNITKGELEAQRTNTGDPNLTKSEVAVGVFAHEIDHNTNQEAIDAIRTRQEGGTNNLNVEQPAKEVQKQVLDEIKIKRP